MAEEKYVNISRLTDKINCVVYRYWNNWYFKGIETDLNLEKYVTLGGTNLSMELPWQILQAVHCTGWNNCSKIKQPLSRMEGLFLMSILRLYPALKLLFEHNNARKNLFLIPCWDSRPFLLEKDQKFKFGGTIDLVTRTWSFYFVISKYLDYMQYCMMRLEHCGQIVVKALATVGSLDEEHVHVC